MSFIEFASLAFSSLFVIIDPLAVVPLFLVITATNTPEQRVRMARVACLVCGAVLAVFGILGKWIFKFLGITIPAFQMAASVVLLLIALDMLRAKRSSVQESTEETEEAISKDDVAITPLAVPMLSGPGAISTTILLQSRASGIAQEISLYVCIAAVCFVSYLILKYSAKGARWLNPFVMRIATRLMGLLLAAIAFQFLINALSDLHVIIPVAKSFAGEH